MANHKGFFSGTVRIALVALLVLVPSSLAAPRQSSSSVCSPTCKTSHDVKLRYEGGKSYTYDFESESITQVTGSTDESSKLKVKGQLVLEASSQCDFVLTIKDASIQDRNGKQVPNMEALTGSSLRFAYQDGTVEDVCVDESDPTWSANIKRGLISMLQNQALKNMGNSVIVEADVNGRCPTQYNVQGDRYIKSRDLLGCSHREDSKLLHHGIRYDVPSRTKSFPVANSTLSCVQDMKKGIVQTVSCKETHQLAAFSENQMGAQTTVVSTLSLQSVESSRRSSATAGSYKPSSIFYDHADTLQKKESKSAAVLTRAILTKVCTEMDASTFSADAPEYFLQLKKAIEYIHHDELKAIHDSLEAGRICASNSKTLKKMLVDAIVQAGSDASVTFVANMYQSLDESAQKGFYRQLAFSPRPGPSALAAVTKLMKSEGTLNIELMLAASGLAHQYCSNHNQDCAEVPEYSALVSFIAKQASTKCLSADASQLEQGIAALQALGNLDSLTSDAVAAIKRCMAGSERVQVRALDASRRDPCNPSLKSHSHHVFADKREPSNVRIQAYIAVSHCLESSDVQNIQTVLEQEESDQVLSYVASHIRNKIRSSKPDLPEVYNHLNQVRYPRSVPQDVFKYSKNYEQSYTSRASDFGGSLDGNLIYSPKSYIPRSLSANASIYALGRSLNILEVGMYTENLERALEKMYKSKNSGKSSRYVWGGKSNYLLKSASSSGEYTPLYNVDEQMEAFYPLAAVSGRSGQQGYGDIYIRILGTTMLVSTLHEDKLELPNVWNSEPVLRDSPRGNNIRMTENVALFDEELVYPTISGMPIKYGFAATGSVDLELSSVSGKPGFFNQGSSGSGASFQARIIPRAALLLRGRMATALGNVESGLQLEGKVHTTSGMDIAITNEKNKFDFKLSFPQEKPSLVEARSDLYWIQAEDEKLEVKEVVKTNAQQNIYSKSSRPQDCYKVDVLGLRFCADIAFPKTYGSGPMAPLRGPMVAGVHIQKADPGMEGYHILVESELEGPKQFIKALVDTPGSRINQKVQVKATLEREAVLKAGLELQSPWKNMELTYEQEFNQDRKAANFAFTLDHEQYSALAQLETSGTQNKKVYKPTISYTSPVKTYEILSGNVEYRPNQKVVAEIQTDAGNYRMFNGKVQVTTEYDYQTKDLYHYTNDITFDYPAWGLGVINHKSSLKHNKPDYELAFTHTFMETGEKGTSHWKLSYVPQQRYEIHGASDCSYFNFANFKLDWVATKQSNQFTNNLSFNHQQGYNNKPVVIKTASRFVRTARNGFDVVNHFTATADNFNVQLELNGKNDVDRSHEYELRAYAGDSHKIDFKLTSGPEVFFNYNLQTSLKYPGQYYELSEVARQVNEYTWNYDTQFIARPGNTYDINAELINKNERSEEEKSFTATIKSDRWDGPQVFKTGLKKESVGITAYLQYDAEGESEVNVVTSYKQVGLQPDNVKMVVYVRKYVDARIQGTRSPSTTNTKIVGKWIPTDRVVKVDAEYKNQGDKWSMDGQVQWDAERDASKQARLTSKTTYTSSYSLESKNELNLENEIHNFDYTIKKGRSIMDGEHLVDAIYRGPKDAKLKVYVQHLGETRPRSTSSKIVGKVQFMRDFPYEIEWENRWANFDKKQMTFEVLTDLKAVSAGNTKLQIVGEAKSLYPPGSVRTLNGNFGVSGSIIPTTMSLKYETEYRGTALKARVEGKYGSKAASVDVGGKIDRYSPKKTIELEYNINMPIQPKSISGKQYYSYVYDSLSHMEISESGSIRFGNEQPTTWSHIIHHISNEFNLESKVTKRGNALWDIEISGSRDRRRTVVDFVGMVKDHGIKFYSNVEGKFPYYNIRSNASVDMPRSRSNNKEYSYLLNHKSSQNGQVIETDLTLVRSGDKFVLSNKLENYVKRKSIDMAFTDGSVPRKMYVMFMNQEPKYTLESYLKWGESGKFLDTKGTLEKTSELIDINVQLNGPSLKINKISAQATQKSSNGRLALDVNVQEKSQQLVKLGLDFGKTSKRSADIYDGSVKFTGRKGLRYSGDFKLEKIQFSKQRDGEQGNMIQGGISFQGQEEPLKFNVSMKNTDVQKQITVTVCSNGETQCRSGDIYYTKEVDGRDLSYEFRATHSSVQGKRSSVDGFNVKSVRSGDDLVHEANVIISEQKENPFGYRMTKKADREYGLDINLPERVISAVLVRDSRPGHEQAEVNIWLNKLRKSHEKLSMIVSYDVLRESSEGAKGYAVSYELKHPELPQNMKINGKVVYGGSNTILDVATEAALFRQGSKLAWTAQITRDDAGKRNGIIYKLKTNIVARQPMIEAQLKGEFHDTEEEKVFLVQTQYKDQDARQGTESKVLASYNSQAAQFKVTLDDETPISWVATWSQPSKHAGSVYDVRHEILLPGMSDSHKIEMHIHTANLPHANMKIYKKDAQSGDFLQAFIGFQSDLQFGVGMYRKENGVRQVLGDFNVALNSSRLLFVKADWDVRNMKNALTSARKQINYATQQFKEVLQETVDESAKKVETMFDRFTDAMPDFTPVMEVYKKEFNNIKKELKKSDEAKMIAEYVGAMETVLDDYFHWVNDVVEFMTETFVAVGDKIAEFIRALPRALGNLRDLVPEWYDAVQEYLEDFMHNLKAMGNSIAQEFERIMKKLPNGHKMWDALYDTTKGVGKATKFAVDMTVETVSEAAKFVKELGADIMENAQVKDYLMQIFARYERMMAKIVEEIKERTDRLRENLLSRFANEEAQEFILAVYNYASKKVQGLRVNDSAAQKDIYEKFVRAVKRAADDMWTVDTQNGLIVAQIPLPKAIGSLQDVDQYLPKLSFDYFGKDFIGHTFDTINSFVKHSDRYIATEVNHVLSLQLASPLTSYALLIGSEYVRTFDGKFYDMHGKGHCRYVLASDFSERNFTIAVEYDEDSNGPQKKIIINYGDFQSVITPDFRVTVRKTADTPYTEGELVAQEGMDHVTVRSTDDNLSVTCDKQHDSCIFTLSKIYHGKTNGLFGNFNSEQHDDFHSPSGSVVHKVASFLKYWKMDPTCEEKPVRSPVQGSSIQRATTGRCAQAFQLESSPMSKCFDAVSPLQFQQMCEEIEVNQSTSKMGNILGVEPVCVVSTAYAQACAKNYKYIPIMTGC